MPYFECHSAKMFIRGKPNRFVYKIWCLCESDGYSYPMQIYQGKQSNAINHPLGTGVINNMVSLISNNSNVLYSFENFLTSDRLMIELVEKSVRATGTIRQNRRGDQTTCSKQRASEERKRHMQLLQ